MAKKKKAPKIPEKYSILVDILNCALIPDPYDQTDWSVARSELAKDILLTLYEIIEKENSEIQDKTYAK